MRMGYRMRAIALLVLSSAAAQSADFRLSNFGESCDRVAAHEATLGSKPLPSNPLEPEYHAFKAIIAEREATILYDCAQGRLQIGHYIFPEQSNEEALQTLQAVYKDIASRYGAPALNSLPLQQQTASPKKDAETTEPEQYMAMWTQSGLFASLGLSFSEQDTGRRWSVFALFGKDDSPKSK
jgi:hypothetical protein